MDYGKLFRAEKPSIHILAMDESLFADLYLQLTQRYPQAAIRMIRGKKSTNVPAFFDEVAGALQFPYYFGENWDALEECIRDLSWLDRNSFLLMINNAHLFLCEAPDKDIRIFIDVLANASETWLTQTTEVGGEELPTPFHVVFACPEDKVPALAQRLKDPRAAIEAL